jgi:succinate-semialdehyde dehydrogenase/glutarate-semialdehyde dehydrogenase
MTPLLAHIKETNMKPSIDDMMPAILESIKSGGWLTELNCIGGEWVGADSGETHSVEDPATGAKIGTIAWTGAPETRRAIDAAQAAFADWSMTTAVERATHLLKMAAIIRDNVEILATLVTLEQGKPIAESRNEVKLGAAYLQWFAEQSRRINGEIVPSPWKGRQILVTREPVGVVGAISTSYMPFLMPARKIAPALAAGCTIVIKAAELTPYGGLVWALIAERAGVPAGVINVLTGNSTEIGRELTSNPLVRLLSFTGSTAVGKLLYAQSAPTMKRLSLELGGNAPFIVFEDADLDRAVEGAVIAKYRNSGQVCISTNRFYIQDGVYDEFARRLTERVRQLKVGNGFDPDVEQGPLLNEAAVKKVEVHVKDARAKGGHILLGGKRHAFGAAFFEPTVISGATAEMLLANEETFGPVAALFRFRNEHEAIHAANSTDVGLTSYFYTRDLSRTFRMSRALQAGMIGINEGYISTEVAPFGGVKDSGLGTEGSVHGIEDFLILKYINVGGL